MANDTAVARPTEQRGIIVSTQDQQELARQLRQNAQTILALIGDKKADPDKVIASVLLAVAEKPDLLRCSRGSLILSVMRAVRMGLDPSGTLGSAYLVPFKGQVQLIPGYRGLVDKAVQCGAALSVWAETYCEEDEWDYCEGTDPYIRHKKYLDGDRGPLKAAYACALIAPGVKQFVIMPAFEIDGFNRGTQPWKDNFLEMAKKTAVRRLCKGLPLNPDRHERLAVLLELDDRADQGMLMREDERVLQQMRDTLPVSGHDRLDAALESGMSMRQIDGSQSQPITLSPAAQKFIDRFDAIGPGQKTELGVARQAKTSDPEWGPLTGPEKTAVLAAETAATERASKPAADPSGAPSLFTLGMNAMAEADSLAALRDIPKPPGLTTANSREWDALAGKRERELG